MGTREGMTPKCQRLGVCSARAFSLGSDRSALAELRPGVGELLAPVLARRVVTRVEYGDHPLHAHRVRHKRAVLAADEAAVLSAGAACDLAIWRPRVARHYAMRRALARRDRGTGNYP